MGQFEGKRFLATLGATVFYAAEQVSVFGVATGVLPLGHRSYFVRAQVDHEWRTS